MDYTAILSAIGAVASAVATIVLVVLTGKYVRLTHELVQESKQAKYPNVFVDIEFDEMDVKFIVGNTGSTPAQNIRFTIFDQVPWRKLDNHPTGINAITAVQSGISYLAPGRTLKFHAGYVERDPGFFADASTIDVAVTFEADADSKFTRQFSIELKSYTGILYESFRDPQREVAKAIRDGARDRQSDESLGKRMQSMFKKPCPTCRELVSPKAKKCPHCQSFIVHGRIARRQ